MEILIDETNLNRNFHFETSISLHQAIFFQNILLLQCPRRCKVTVERVFRGKKFDKPFVLEAATYKADYRLLSKKEEADYCKSSVREEKIIAPYMELPPLLREFVEKETGRKDVKMKVHHKGSIMTPARLAKEGEKPNIVISIGLGKPHPTGLSLYDGINI